MKFIGIVGSRRRDSHQDYLLLVSTFDNVVDIAKASDILIAMVADDRTGGTESTITAAKKFGRRIVLI